MGLLLFLILLFLVSPTAFWWVVTLVAAFYVGVWGYAWAWSCWGCYKD